MPIRVFSFRGCGCMLAWDLASESSTSFQRSMSRSRSRESIRIRRIDTAIACARARNADGGDVSAEHEIAQRPVAAAKIRRCRSKVHEPAAWRSRSSCAWQSSDEPSSRRPSRKSHARARPRRRQGRQPAMRVERSESLDDARGERQNQRRDGRRTYFAVKLRTAAVKFRGWIRATTRRSIARPIAALCSEAVLASVARVKKTRSRSIREWRSSARSAGGRSRTET